ncbi:MAG: rhodanese-like domain-containing protein [Bacteroidota bacterium]
MKTSVKNIFKYAIFIIFAGCTGIYEDGNELADDLKSVVKQISVSDLNAKIENGEDFLLIDVRQPKDYHTGNIPGSVLLPRGIIEVKIEDENFWAEQYMYPPVKDSTEIIIYCKSGKRGILATRTLLQLGYKNVINLDGGYDAFNPNQDPNSQPIVQSGGCGG